MVDGHVVVAPDSFKGSLDAQRVAAALAAGIRKVHPEVRIVEHPVADGGEGTVAAVLRTPGMRAVPVTVCGPSGLPVRASYAMSGTTAVVELAEAAGLHLLDGLPSPSTAWMASTVGVGELIRHALSAGAEHVVLGLGGSATTDGGAGMLTALGARVLDADAKPVAPGAAGLVNAYRLDVSGLEDLAGVRLDIACDVDNPLVGTQGAAAVYGPQKGATPADVPRLDAVLMRWAELVSASTGTDLRLVPGTGAAGGTAFAALSLFGGRIVSGVEAVLAATGFASEVAGARLVITGEGRFDAQSLRGKAPVGVAAASGGAPVVVACGQHEGAVPEGFEAVYALTDIEPDAAVCMADAERLLEELGARIARERIT